MKEKRRKSYYVYGQYFAWTTHNERQEEIDYDNKKKQLSFIKWFHTSLNKSGYP